MPDTKAKIAYDARTAYKVGIKLNRKTDADIIKALDASPNKQALVKQALRAYIGKENATMTERRYHVLPEYQDSWYGGIPTAEIGDAIVTETEIQRLAHEWGVTVDELMEQVEEI